MALYIYASNPATRELLSEQLKHHRWTDSGFDIPLPTTTVYMTELVHSFSLGVHVAATDGTGGLLPCILLSRSSIHKLPFRMCNSIGLIDAGYRGEVLAKTDVLERDGHPLTLTLDNGSRLFQICQHSFLPWKNIVLVDTLDELPSANDTRGAGGFGSTDLQLENHPRT